MTVMTRCIFVFFLFLTPLAAVHDWQAVAQSAGDTIGFGGDIKIIPPQRLNAVGAAPQVETLNDLSAGQLLHYLHANQPNLTLDQVLAANPDLGDLTIDSVIPAGTIITIPTAL